MHVFAFGSLVNPDSLRSTLPGIDVRSCVPARAEGYVRSFDVAFPNDGSQGDKRYYDDAGSTPPHVLMCDLRPEPAYAANGICIPVDDEVLARLTDRERRYELTDITAHVRPYGPGFAGVDGPVLAFLGRQEFTAPPAHGAVVSREYLHTIHSGAQYWDPVAPEFTHLLMATTLFPPAERIIDLRRVDAPGILGSGRP